MKKLSLAKETLKRLEDQDVLGAAGASTGCPTLTLCQPTVYNSCRVCPVRTVIRCTTSIA